MSKQVTFRDNSDEIMSLFSAAKHRGLEAIGMSAERHAKQNLRDHVDTGRLRNSITYAVSGYKTHVKDYRQAKVAGGAGEKHPSYEYADQAMEGKKDDAVYIGTNVEYGKWVELGTGIYASDGQGKKEPWAFQDNEGKWHLTSGIKPVHFLKKAATEHGEEYKNLMENSMKNA